MREINIIFNKTKIRGFSAVIQEMPEIEVTADTLPEVQRQIFQLLPLVMKECFHERSYKVNISLKLSISNA
jgi:predicted nuclease of restriction endonuclease-like RecB superfamily